MSTNKSEETSTPIHPFIIGSLIVVGVWLSSILIINFLFDDAHNEKAAWFGDSFGSVNSLFSGLAFAGIIYTILLQRKELQLQRQELRETRQELKRSADAQEKSEAAFTKQIEIMNKTAQLNGWSHIMDYYHQAFMKTTPSDPHRSTYHNLRGEARNKIQEILAYLDGKLPESNTESHTE